ncbi:unnamed protein product, partial [Ixodes pacificus]
RCPGSADVTSTSSRWAWPRTPRTSVSRRYTWTAPRTGWSRSSAPSPRTPATTSARSTCTRSSPTSCASPCSLFINSGSSINVSCAIEHSPEPPVFVFWYHNDRMINYDAAKGGPGHISGGKRGQDAYVSSLFIRNARQQDSGNYTCGPSNADSTSVVVHVLNGEKRAAVHHDLS